MIIILAIACGLFAVGFFAVFIKWRGLKKDLRQTGEKLAAIAVIETNEQLKTLTFDKDIASLVRTVNILLKKHRDDYIEINRIESVLKRAITNISHDLRTPLTSAKGYLQMLEGLLTDLETAVTDEKVYYLPNTLLKSQRHISIINGRLEALTVLMDNLFAFTQAVEGNINPERVNIGNLLRDALSAQYAVLEKRGFAVESTIPDAPVYAMVDEAACKRVIHNLLTNAHVHGRDKLWITLNETEIIIGNLTENAQNINTTSIFDRFYTADAARTHKHTGLGLAIAKELTEKMGGTLTAEVEGERFSVRLVPAQS